MITAPLNTTLPHLLAYQPTSPAYTDPPRMADASVKKIDSAHSPQGPMGQTYLASGTRVAMRMWDEEPGDAYQKEAHARDYETVGYVLEGKAELHLEGQTIQLTPGDSWVVPEGAEHHYDILETFKAVEATAPPARVHERDEG